MSGSFLETFKILVLCNEANEAHQTGQYALMEALLVEAARLADEHADLNTRILVHSRLVDAWRMLYKHQEALTTLTWLIGLGNDPQESAALIGQTGVLGSLAMAYAEIVDTARHLAVMPTVELHRVLDQGMAFLDNVGQKQWGHVMRLYRGMLYEIEGRLPESRQEFEAALAMRRREQGIGMNIGTHLNHLGNLLVRMEDYEAARRCYLEILEEHNHLAVERQRATTGMAWLEKGRGNLEAAEQWAREAVELAEYMETPSTQFFAREALVATLLSLGYPAEAAQEAPALWLWSRRYGNQRARYLMSQRLLEVRLAMARKALGLNPVWHEPVPEIYPNVDREALPRSRRYLAAAEAWLARAQEAAGLLDAQAGIDGYLKALDQQAQALQAVRGFLLKTLDS